MTASKTTSQSKTSLQVAIDGPVAAGKGTISKLVAERLGFLYVDTGATYRVAALLATRAGVDPANEAAVAALLDSVDIVMRNPEKVEKDGRLITLLIEGEDVSWAIRTEEISAIVPVVAQHPAVREKLVAVQQAISASQDVVMEGRDITYIVLPDADLKIFLTASDVVRARRRHQQLQAKGEDISFEEVFEQLLRRDRLDSERDLNPLKIVEDAVVIDTSDLSIEQVVDMITARVVTMREVA